VDRGQEKRIMAKLHEFVTLGARRLESKAVGLLHLLLGPF